MSSPPLLLRFLMKNKPDLCWQEAELQAAGSPAERGLRGLMGAMVRGSRQKETERGGFSVVMGSAAPSEASAQTHTQTHTRVSPVPRSERLHAGLCGEQH